MKHEITTLQDVLNSMGCTHEEFETITGYGEEDFLQQHGADVQTLDNPIMEKLGCLIEQVEANLKNNRATQRLTKMDARKKLVDAGDTSAEQHYHVNQWFRTPLEEIEGKTPIQYLMVKGTKGVDSLIEITTQ